MCLAAIKCAEQRVDRHPAVWRCTAFAVNSLIDGNGSFELIVDIDGFC